jgi:hypothetical protein
VGRTKIRTMSLYLSKLESKLDKALSKETRESLTDWIGFKRNKPKTTRTMNFENIKTAEDYETLLVQFNALKAIAISQQAKLEHYQNKIHKFSFERVIQLEAELESEKEMNAILTKELELKQQEQ